MHVQLNKVNVNFNIFVMKKEEDASIEKKKIHNMRYFFDTELEMLSEQYGFSIETKYGWLNHEKSDFDAWNVAWVLRLIG